jgi:hypothetical protein
MLGCRKTPRELVSICMDAIAKEQVNEEGEGPENEQMRGFKTQTKYQV